MSTNTVKYNAVLRGFTKIFLAELAKYSQVWPQLAMLIRSNSLDESYVWLEAVPGMKEFLGTRVFQSLRSSTFTITNKPWEQSIGIDRHAIDDDRYGLYSPIVRRMAQKASIHPDQLLFELIANGHTQTCYDGQYFYDTDHSTGDSGSQSNDLTYAAATGTSPTVAEFRAAFTAALIKMLSFKDDQGDFFIESELMDPGNLQILVPPAMWEVAVQAMNQLVTVDSGAGVTNVMIAKGQVRPIQRLSTAGGGSDAVFHLVYNGGPIRPFIFQLRQPLVTETKGLNSIEDKEAKMMSEARYNVGYGLWQYAIRTEFT